MAFSTAIATFGINADSTAVVIGAMLIAPLMTPIMATSASLLMGWPVRATRSMLLVGAGVAIAVAGSWLLSRYFPVLEVTTNSQILSRVSPTTVDLMIAFAAGAAGAFAISRPDVADSLPGVAIAVALVPPLAVIGITLEAAEWSFALGATLLFVTNLVGVILAAGITFVLVGFSPWFHLEANRTQINRSYATVGIALLLIAIPLTLAGEELLVSVTNSSKATAVVDDWLEAAPGYEQVSVTIQGSDVEVVVGGSGDLPSPQALADDFADEFGREMTVDLSVVPDGELRADRRTLRERLAQPHRGVRQHRVAAFFGRGREDDPVAFVPHRGHDRLAGEHHAREPHLIARHLGDVAVEHLVDDRLARRPVRAQPVQDRGLEPGNGGELGVGVERVLVARQPVEQRLVAHRRRLDDGVGCPLGGRVAGLGPGSPPKPPSPRAKIENRLVNSGPSASELSTSSTTRPALPLS